jgi:hypothetical protein
MPENDPTYEANDAKTWLLGYDLRELKKQQAQIKAEEAKAEAEKQAKAAEKLGVKHAPNHVPNAKAKNDQADLLNGWGDLWASVDGG